MKTNEEYPICPCCDGLDIWRVETFTCMADGKKVGRNDKNTPSFDIYVCFDCGFVSNKNERMGWNTDEDQD